MIDRSAPIIAIATAPGRGAVGIVRASGTGLTPWVSALCQRELTPREATLVPLRDADGHTLDQVIALFFPGPHSYTGEDVLELQAHGGPVVLQLLQGLHHLPWNMAMLLAKCCKSVASVNPTQWPFVRC